MSKFLRVIQAAVRRFFTSIETLPPRQRMVVLVVLIACLFGQQVPFNVPLQLLGA